MGGNIVFLDTNVPSIFGPQFEVHVLDTTEKELIGPAWLGQVSPWPIQRVLGNGLFSEETVSQGVTLGIHLPSVFPTDLPKHNISKNASRGCTNIPYFLCSELYTCTVSGNVF